jgi:hypothetical protein
MNNSRVIQRHKNFIGWLAACLAVCLLPSGVFGSTAERTEPLQISDDKNTTITFSAAAEDNYPANDSTGVCGDGDSPKCYGIM